MSLTDIYGDMDGLRTREQKRDELRRAEWRCPDCDCRVYARVDERKPGGKFGPGPQVRCVSCKAVFDRPSR